METEPHADTKSAEVIRLRMENLELREALQRQVAVMADIRERIAIVRQRIKDGRE